ncbi:MAG: C40 family peptidase, partial [Muribaculaceae bacterium]|nr:C40 family peptidase [Muribaculaceae bacterium]
SQKDTGSGRHKTERLHNKKSKKKKRGSGSINVNNGKWHSELSKSDNGILREAAGWLGTPYGYSKAEKGKACDCSGMVMSVYEKVEGVKLPRNSAQQQDFCRKLKAKDIREGDLCFFATGKDPDRTSHVGIMIDDTNFIHASTSKGVVVSDITQPYWVKTFKGYGRVPLKIKD